MEPGLRTSLEQRLILAPQIIQSIEILQMPILDLQERISQELEENPVLEIREGPPEPSLQEEPPEKAPLTQFERLEGPTEEWREYFSQFARRRSGDETNPKMEALANTPAPPITLQEYLRRQLGLQEITPEERRIGEEIVFNIDENGYLQYPLEEIIPEEERQSKRETYEKMLRLIQTFDPPGVGARDLKECLLLQLDPSNEEADLQKELILNHLEDLQKNRLPAVAKKTGRSLEEIKRAMELIGSLHPRPGRLFSNEQTVYIIPDIIVEKTDGNYEVRVQDQHLPRLYVSPLYREILERRNVSPETYQFIRKKVESARWLLEAIEQRRETLLKISKAIVEFQQPFLEKGIEYLKPLKMKDVAERVGVHVSTVSRAISAKYIQTPSGIFPMKYFFTGGKRSTDGQVHSWRTIKQRIAELIEKEDKSHPLSDDEIAATLSAAGLNVARRTVTKYRKALNIPSSRERKIY